MQEHQLRTLIEHVRLDELPRRRFIQPLAGLGLSAPMASLLLMHEGVAQTAPPIPYKPTRRGGVTLKLMWWPAPRSQKLPLSTTVSPRCVALGGGGAADPAAGAGPSGPHHRRRKR